MKLITMKAGFRGVLMRPLRTLLSAVMSKDLVKLLWSPLSGGLLG